MGIYKPGFRCGVVACAARGHIACLKLHMTLTAPGCPVAGSMPEWVENAVRHQGGVESVKVELVWEPPWTPERMSMRAKLELNML